MGIFGKQLQEREKNDRKIVQAGERMLAETIGKSHLDYSATDPFIPEDQRQVELIAQYIRIKTPENIQPCRDLSEMLDVMLHPSGAAKRRITLTDKWWIESDGPILAVIKESGKARALFPGFLQGLYYLDPDTGKKVRVTKKNKDMFDRTAWHIYRPLPPNVRTGKDYLLYLIRRISPGTLMMYALTSVFVAVLGMLSPFAMKIAFSRIIPTRQTMLLISLMVMLTASVIGGWLTASVRFSVNQRIKNQLFTEAENSLYYKVLNLPASFFSGKTAGGLSQRIAAINTLPEHIGNVIFIITNAIIAFLMGLPVLIISPKLILPAFAAVLLVILLLVVTVRQEKRLEQARLQASEENGGTVFDIISGVQRIRISASEDRAYGRWLVGYSKQAGASYAVVFPLCIRPQLVTTIRLACLFWAFFIAYTSQLSVSDLAAFSAAYGMMFGSLIAVIPRCKSISMIEPCLKAGEDILAAETENNADKTLVTHLNGGIELNHLTFRYEPDGPAILDDLNLKIHPGEYVAIVGRSGCGKSTLIKLLLGFEYPESGTIFYDRSEIRELDLQSLRRNIGTVLQDGKLFAGNVFSNIAITAPWLTEEEAWDAAEKSGIAEDIRNMPMGMNTILSEGGGGISGGQKQRLMIARAIAPHPGILILDEATSALDNLTQKKVTESLDRMDCTRIVIAHRLTTIQECDRIIAMDGGHIVESGTYDELVHANGFFADLVSRQQIDGPDGAVPDTDE